MDSLDIADRYRSLLAKLLRDRSQSPFPNQLDPTAKKNTKRLSDPSRSSGLMSSLDPIRSVNPGALWSTDPTMRSEPDMSNIDPYYLLRSSMSCVRDSEEFLRRSVALIRDSENDVLDRRETQVCV